MTIFCWIFITYSLISLLSLFNKGIRHLYLETINTFYGRFLRVNKKYYKVVVMDYVNLVLGCLSDILILLIYFVLAPIIIIYHFPKGFTYRFTREPYWKLKKKPINKAYLRPALIIKVEEDIPFVPDTKQVIYFENTFNDPLNHYISENHDEIVAAFRERGYTFIYLPNVVEGLGVDEARYMNPSIKETEVSADRDSIYHDTKNRLTSLIQNATTPPLTGGLLRYRESDEDCHIFAYYHFTNPDEIEIAEQIRAYVSAVGMGGVMYKISVFPKSEIDAADFADENFDIQSLILISEIRERVKALKQKGINEMVLKSLFSFDTVELSRLVITSEYRIFLPDYNNMEITMHPLPKAVYLLFLLHPEGILFKYLIDYRDELIQIYKKVSGREDIKQMEQSIHNVVNPSLNSINEKCSRIKEAFVKHFDDSIAQHYYITGGKATPKKIILNRELVRME